MTSPFYSSPRDAAFAYLARGWAPLPIQPGTKHAAIKWKEFQQRLPTTAEVGSWFQADAQVAIVTGAVSGIIVIDVDGPDGEAGLAQLGPIPSTLSAKTARGRHLVFKHPGMPIPTRVGILPGVDVRGDGGYVLGDPSFHPSGSRYAWENFDVPIADLPPHLLALLTQSKPVQRIAQGLRNSALAREAGRLFGQGLPETEVLEQCQAYNQDRCDPPLPTKEVDMIVASIAAREARKRPSSPSQVNIRSLASVTPTPVEWLWPGYLAAGKLQILDGDPSLGKSTLTCDLAARISTGQSFPDGAPGVTGDVLILNAEDGAADTIVPRIVVHGGDTNRIHCLDIQVEGGRRPLVFPDDLPALREAVEQTGARLVVIDPLMAHLATKVNSWNDQHVRTALAPLAQLAEDTGATILLVRHPNKRSGVSALYRGGGSVGIIGAARLGFLIGPHPDDNERRVLAPTKNNLGALAQSLEFQIQTGPNGAGQIMWLGQSQLTADDLVQPLQVDVSRVDEAVDFLQEQLSAGPVESKRLTGEAKRRGLAERTLNRARRQLGVTVRRDASGWISALPAGDQD